MKIVTWNAQMKFREKIKYILPFAPDLMVIPECEAPEKWGQSTRGIFLQYEEVTNEYSSIK